jgi:2-oxoglutarate ferredoxin oxidoreductase subunit gamma
MEQSIIIAGFGGQGVLLCGKILANIFMKNDKKVTWFPCYGSEMRGGAVNCEIVVSEEEVTSVHKKETDILVTLNDISYNKFINQVKANGTVIANTTLIKNIDKNFKKINFIEAPISDIALELGNVKVTNMVALGVISKIYPNIDFAEVNNIIDNMFSGTKKYLADINKKAFETGSNYN